MLYVISPKNSSAQIGSYTPDYLEVFKAWKVHEMVIEDLELPYTNTQLRDMLYVENPSNTHILSITVSAHDPSEAAAIANSYANVVKKFISAKIDTDEPEILSDAQQPAKPVTPHKVINMLLGILSGMLLGIMIVTIQFVMDDKIKSADEVMQYFELPTLALVPAMENEKVKNTWVKGDR